MQILRNAVIYAFEVFSPLSATLDHLLDVL
jgi:hypothetical protein